MLQRNLCAIVASGYQQELKLLLSKLNRMDAKIDHLSRKLNVFLSTGNSGCVDVPAVPDGMTLPADTVKNVTAAASMVVRVEVIRKKLASISVCL